VHRKTLIAFAAALALGSVPVATSAFAAPRGHASGGAHAAVAHGGHGFAAGRGAGHFARSGGGNYGGRSYGGGYYGGGPVYDSCAGYGDPYGYGPGYPYGGCSGVPLVGRVINGVLGGYGPY
jgi:hypothetical protein